MKNPVKGPPEWKVAVPATLGGVITVLTLALHEYVPGFHPPSAALVAGIVTTVTAIAGYLAPHTSRLKPLPPGSVVTGPERPSPELEMEKLRAVRATLEKRLSKPHADPPLPSPEGLTP